MANINYAYYSGLFDGEGTVSAYTCVRKQRTKSCALGQKIMNMHLSISNNDRLPLDILKNSIGGSISKDNDGWKWIGTADTADYFLDNITKYSQIKNDQLAIYKKLSQSRQLNQLRTKISDSEWVWREKLTKQLYKEKCRYSNKPLVNGLRLLSERS